MEPNTDLKLQRLEVWTGGNEVTVYYPNSEGQTPAVPDFRVRGHARAVPALTGAKIINPGEFHFPSNGEVAVFSLAETGPRNA